MSAKQVFVRLSSAKCQLGTVGQLRDVLDSNFRCQTNDTYNLYEIIYYFIIPLNDLVSAITRYSFAIAILQLLEKVTAKLHSPLFPTLEGTHFSSAVCLSMLHAIQGKHCEKYYLSLQNCLPHKLQTHLMQSPLVSHSVHKNGENL